MRITSEENEGKRGAADNDWPVAPVASYPRTSALAALAVLALLTLWQPPSARAATSGGTTNNQTVTQPSVRSITVSLAAVTCAPALTFPNGNCNTVGVSVTNGLAGHVNVNGANDIPADNGVPWTLCGSPGPACSGVSGAPGLDQYREHFNIVLGIDLTNSPTLDTAFGVGGVAATDQIAREPIQETAPSSSTDTSTSFSTQITWTAVP